MNNSPGPIPHDVVVAVASRTDRDPLELPPLYDAVDADALAALLSGSSEAEVWFRYAGASVYVDGEGTVEVSDAPRTLLDARRG